VTTVCTACGQALPAHVVEARAQQWRHKHPIEEATFVAAISVGDYVRYGTSVEGVVVGFLDNDNDDARRKGLGGWLLIEGVWGTYPCTVVGWIGEVRP
jgi:hypothetical protein